MKNKPIPSRKRVVEILFAFASIWALLAGAFIFFVPMGMSVTVSSSGGLPISTPISFFEMQGWWGIWILIVFAALYYAPLHFYKRNNRGLAMTFALVAILLSILAGFTIGMFYSIGAIALLIGLILMLIEKKAK